MVHGLGQATGSNAQPAPPAGAGTPSWTGAFAESVAPGYPAGVVPAGVAPPPATGPDVTLQVSFGVMSVHDSDGAVALEVGFVHDDFGLVVRGRSFFEAQSTGSTLRLDLGSIQAAFRAISSGEADLWLEGGVGGVATIDDIHAYGAVAGARIERKLFGDVSVRAAAHYYFLADGVRLLELGGGLRLTCIEVAYRLFDFNVGPPLHGPELSLALTF
ncbi:MAG TPA: hypothetical protein VKE22_00600 [Haliangiales bacterium]|nr:hypothetical protein [Haliangiales bacterium]